MKKTVCALLVLFAALLSAEELTIAPRQPTAQEKADAARELSRLAAGLRQVDVTKFKAAADGLAANGSERALKYLQETYPRVDGVRRRVLLQTLGRMKPASAADWFYALSIQEPYLGLQRAAAEALVATEGRAVASKRYANALRGTDTKLNSLGRQRAVQLLAHVGGKASAATVRSFLDDPEPNVVMAACDALAVMHDEKAASLLVNVLARRDEETGPAAQEALERVTGQKLGSSLLKWRQWLRERNAAQVKVDAYDEEGKYEPDYGRPYEMPLSETAVDLVVVYDTTGSLGKIWPEVSAHIDAVLAEMAERCHSLRLGTVRYRSDKTRHSRYAIQPLPLTRNLQRARDNILDASFGGGSGGLHIGLRHAISAFQWRAHARKVVLIVGDVTPVGEGLRDCLKVIYEGRELDRIYFNCVFIRSLHGEEHRPAYSRLAEMGEGRFYEFDRAWRHLVDRSEAKVNPKLAEQPVVTLKKWMTPHVRESVQK